MSYYQNVSLNFHYLKLIFQCTNYFIVSLMLICRTALGFCMQMIYTVFYWHEIMFLDTVKNLEGNWGKLKEKCVIKIVSLIINQVLATSKNNDQTILKRCEMRKTFFPWKSIWWFSVKDLIIYMFHWKS